MSKMTQIMGKNAKIKLVGVLLFLACLSVFPTVASSKSKKLYVDNHRASDNQNGSSEHPYKTISEAIDHADSNTEIHVAKGTYWENITLKKDIKLFGEDQDNTIISAKKGKWAVVTMEDDSEIDGFTIREGKRGIWVESHAEVSITDCIIKKNKWDGIAIEGGNTSKSNAVTISESEIKENGKNGIFNNKKRRIILTGNEIRDNFGDGVELATGSSAWVSGNSIKDNRGSGMKLTVDGSDIWTKNNSIRQNKREGIEVSFSGKKGRINVAKSKIVENKLNGVSRIQKGSFSGAAGLWSQYLTFEGKNEFWGNDLREIANIIRVN